MYVHKVHNNTIIIATYDIIILMTCLRETLQLISESSYNPVCMFVNNELEFVIMITYECTCMWLVNYNYW